MKLQTDNGTFTGEDRWIAIYLSDELKKKVEKGALMTNILFPVRSRYEKSTRKGIKVKKEKECMVYLRKQDIENIRNMPEEYRIYSICPEDRDNEEIHELNEEFKKEVKNNG